MIKRKKLLYTNILGVGILVLSLIINTTLINTLSVVTVEEAPNRHIIYWSMVILTNVSYNFLAMYVGSKILQDTKPLKRLSKIVMFYFYLIVLCMFTVICYSKNFSYQDILNLFFPLSRNIYPFALIILVCYIFGSIFAEQIKLWSSKQKKAVISLLIWFIVVLPLIFNQNLWGISSGQSTLWLIMLFILGMLWQLPQSKNRLIKDVIALVILVIAIVATVKYLPLTQDPVNLQGKIFSPYSILSFLTTVVIFDIYYIVNKGKSFNRGNWLIFNTYLLIHTPIFTNLVKNEFSIENNLRFEKWILLICRNVLIISLISVVFCIVILGILKIPTVKKGISRYEVNDDLEIVGLYNICRQLIFENRRLILIAGICYVITVTQFVAVRTTAEVLSLDLIKDVITNQSGKVFLTFLIYLAIFYLLYALLNKYIYSVFIIIVCTSLITIAEYLKIKMRNEPILSTDLALISTLPEVLKMINQSLVYIVLGSMVILLIITILISRRIEPKMQYGRQIRWYRIKTFIYASIFLTLILWKSNLNVAHEIILNSVDYQNIFWDATEGAKTNGPVLQFANDFVKTKMKQPEGYTEENIEKIKNKYTKIAKEINTNRKNSLSNQTVIFVLSESFSDPSRIPGLTIDKNPIPFITSLKQQTPSGLMVSSGYGGGTANLEWQALSGMAYGNLVANVGMPYYQIVPGQKSAPAITDLFKNKIAIHPYTAAFYNRIGVFKKYGFQHFYYEGSKDKLTYTDRIDANPYISDESAYEEVIKHVNESKGSTFIQLSTMQNHQGYDINNYAQNDFEVSGAAVTDDNRAAVEGYIEGISKTDEATKNFIDQINQINKPITVVWYGDHLPGVYSIDLEKEALNAHETDYFVYSNQATEKLNNNQIAGPYEFPALALVAGNNKVTPYYALLTEVAEKLPVISTNITGKNTGSDSILINEDNKIISADDLTAKQKELLHDYRLIQYDLLVGKQYSAKWAQQKLK